MKHEYLVLDCIRNLKTLINEYVMHQHKNSMTERSRKARRVISNFTLPKPKEEGEKELKHILNSVITCIIKEMNQNKKRK